MAHAKSGMNMNDVVFDSEAKEFVRITNMICTLDHSTLEAFKVSHGEKGMGACEYEPHEAIALRVVGITKTGDPIIALTYRGVKASNLRPADPGSMIDLDKVRRGRFIGRV